MKNRKGYYFDKYGQRRKNVVHLFVANSLRVACGEFNHTVEHTIYKNRITCEECLKTTIKKI